MRQSHTLSLKDHPDFLKNIFYRHQKSHPKPFLVSKRITFRYHWEKKVEILSQIR